jgi:hypothetical protein
MHLVGKLLRVPLHGDDPMRPVLECLDRPVFGPGHRAEAIAHTGHGLMMERVDPQLVDTEDPPELAVGSNADGVDQLLAALDD